MSPTIRDVAPLEQAAVEAGRLPPRYGGQMQSELMDRLTPLLEPGVAILDVGSGRGPTLAPEDRPPGCHYVGLDVSEDELRAADRDAYDETIVHDIARRLPVDAQFDLVISWQVLEHVRPLDAALESLRHALRPGGTLLAQLSGSFASFALASRLMPHRLRVLAMSKLLGHRVEEKFPTHYDRCYHRALERMLEPWSSATVIPFYRGATYLSFFRPFQRVYLGYESLAARRGMLDLATHYLVVARR
ncbi:MAG: methyltransferase domain-containing protein [Thermoleophilaceae bacterium]